MSEQYKIFGAELSPYSVKVRSYFRYKGISHKWLIRGPSNQKEYLKYAKIPIVPLVVSPAKEGFQDSTPIIDMMENLYPEPSVHPEDETLKFLSILLEEYADEWGNKHMFHYRWKAEIDQDSASRRIANMNLPLFIKIIPIAKQLFRSKISKSIKQRMSNRLWVIGSNENTQRTIESSFHNLLVLLQEHLKGRSYIFGERPSYADFALWGQIYNAWQDPTPNKFILDKYSGLLDWIKRMHNPDSKGAFEKWETLENTLYPILKTEVGEVFLPWSNAVTNAMKVSKEEVSVKIKGQDYIHNIGGPQKYHVKSLKVLKKKYNLIKNKTNINKILNEIGCLENLL